MIQTAVKIIDQIKKYLNCFFGLKKYPKAEMNSRTTKSANIGFIAKILLTVNALSKKALIRFVIINTVTITLVFAYNVAFFLAEFK